MDRTRKSKKKPRCDLASAPSDRQEQLAVHTCIGRGRGGVSGRNLTQNPTLSSVKALLLRAAPNKKILNDPYNPRPLWTPGRLRHHTRCRRWLRSWEKHAFVHGPLNPKPSVNERLSLQILSLQILTSKGQGNPEP